MGTSWQQNGPGLGLELGLVNHLYVKIIINPPQLSIRPKATRLPSPSLNNDLQPLSAMFEIIFVPVGLCVGAVAPPKY